MLLESPVFGAGNFLVILPIDVLVVYILNLKARSAIYAFVDYKFKENMYESIYYCPI